MTKVVVGVCLLGLGVVGLFLPILQGVLFIFLGLAILATESRRVRDLMERLKRFHPGPWRRAEAMKRRISQWLHPKRREESDKEVSGDEGSSRETG
jgi:uncharacterized membrane protein YbaN (DUF454 family)